MKKRILLACLIFTQLVEAKMTLEQQRKILENRLFSSPISDTNTSKEFYLPLHVNGILQDEVLVKIDQRENILIPKESMAYIATLLKDEYASKFKQDGGKDGLVPLKNVEQLGITANYNGLDAILDITIPVEKKTPSIVHFSNYSVRDDNGSLRAKPLSGGINFYLNQYYNKYNSKSFEANALNLSSDYHLNLYDYVLEGRLQYYEEEKKISRGRMRLVKNIEAYQLQIKLGDITLPAHNRMSYTNALGIGIENNLYRGGSYTQNYKRVNSHEFIIQNRSRIEVYVNDQYQKTLHLDAGSYNLDNLNLLTGISNVRLRIIEDGGKVEVIDFNDFNYGELLAKGVVRYGAGVGVESQQKQNYEWEYYHDRIIASGYVEYGLFDALTVEGGIQKAEDYLSGSAELQIGTNFGLFNPYIVYSKKSDKVGYKKGIEYRTNLGPVQLNVAYEKIDEDYESLSQMTQEYYRLSSDNFFSSLEHNASTNYRVNLSTQLGWGIYLGLSASSSKINGIEEKTYQALLRKNFDSLDAEINLRRTENTFNNNDTKVYLSLTYHFGRDYSIRSINYLTENNNQFNLRRMSPSRYGIDAELQYKNNKDNNNYYLSTNIENEKFRLSSTYSVNDLHNNTSESMGIQFATGAVFAGTTATITEPMTSSFVIIDNDDKLEKSLGIQGLHEENEFKYDTYALEMNDFTNRSFVVDESDLDFGIDLKHSIERFRSNYKNGFVFNVDVENFYTLKGVFYDKKTKEPVSSKAFKVFNADTGEKSMSFTNEDGSFVIHHMGIGHYNITFVKESIFSKAARYKFVIEKEDTQRLRDMGAIYIDMPEKVEIDEEEY